MMAAASALAGAGSVSAAGAVIVAHAVAVCAHVADTATAARPTSPFFADLMVASLPEPIPSTNGFLLTMNTRQPGESLRPFGKNPNLPSEDRTTKPRALVARTARGFDLTEILGVTRECGALRSGLFRRLSIRRGRKTPGSHAQADRHVGHVEQETHDEDAGQRKRAAAHGKQRPARTRASGAKQRQGLQHDARQAQ